MSNCNPKSCDDIQERIAIMQHDGGVKGGLLTKALSDACKGCDRRDKRGDQILKELRG